jgi:hypothetical protein
VDNPSVIPAQAGIHAASALSNSLWIPACAGMTGYTRIVAVRRVEKRSAFHHVGVKISLQIANSTPHAHLATRHRALPNAGDAQRKMVEGAALFHPTGRSGPYKGNS